jgi:hypothetical protein
MTELQCDPKIPLLNIYPGELAARTWTDTCIPIVQTTLFTVPKWWKQLQCPLIDKCVNSIWYIHVSNNVQPSKGMKSLMHAEIWKLLERSMLNEINQTQRCILCI